MACSIESWDDDAIDLDRIIAENETVDNLMAELMIPDIDIDILDVNEMVENDDHSLSTGIFDHETSRENGLSSFAKWLSKKPQDEGSPDPDPILEDIDFDVETLWDTGPSISELLIDDDDWFFPDAFGLTSPPSLKSDAFRRHPPRKAAPYKTAEPCINSRTTRQAKAPSIYEKPRFPSSMLSPNPSHGAPRTTSCVCIAPQRPQAGLPTSNTFPRSVPASRKVSKPVPVHATPSPRITQSSSLSSSSSLPVQRSKPHTSQLPSPRSPSFAQTTHQASRNILTPSSSSSRRVTMLPSPSGSPRSQPTLSRSFTSVDTSRLSVSPTPTHGRRLSTATSTPNLRASTASNRLSHLPSLAFSNSRAASQTLTPQSVCPSTLPPLPNSGKRLSRIPTAPALLSASQRSSNWSGLETDSHYARRISHLSLKKRQT
ncbi:uncharacterized protein VTP21DRAFT_3338 [Calcarisporiella thermophila]|uniref:uncharacterized protein n=1 Tax=Calcarisporiella thermophila TaxID=911321 RepID=UPI003743129A